MSQGHYGSGGKLNVSESNPDINQHTENRNQQSPNRILLHFCRNRSGNILGNNLILGNRKLLLKAVIQLGSFLCGHSSGLNDNLIGSRNLCRLGRSIPACSGSKQRNNLTIHFLHAQILIEGNGGGRTALKVQVIVKEVSGILLIHSKEYKSYNNNCGRDSIGNLSESDKVKHFAFLLNAVQVGVCCSQSVEGG